MPALQDFQGSESILSSGASGDAPLKLSAEFAQSDLLKTYPLLLDDLLCTIAHTLVRRRLPWKRFHGLNAHFNRVERVTHQHLQQQK